MSLPVTSININYEDEKGLFSFWYFHIPCLIFPDKINNFLSTFKSSREDLAQDFANIGIDDEDGPPAAGTSLKYMHQLVRVVLLFDASLARLTLNLATGCKSWSTNACDWLGGYLKSAMHTISMKWFWPLFSTNQQCLNLYLAYKTIPADMLVFSVTLLTNSCHSQRKTLATKMKLSMSFYIKGVNVMSSWRVTKMDSQNTCFDDSTFSYNSMSRSLTRQISNLYFKPLTSDIPMAVRDVKGLSLGRLITVRGIVTRVSEVKPLLQVNAYTCDVCGSETFQDISNKTFKPILDCENENECKKNGIHGSLHMQTRACRFSPFQEVKIQEMVNTAPHLFC